MPRLLRPSPLLSLLAVLLLTLLALAAQELRLYERAWFSVKEWRHAAQWRERSLWLPDYRASIDALPIDGLEDLSALTYDPQRKSLFTVTNKRPQVVELSLRGDVLRRIDLHGFEDPEAIEYIAPGLFVISDERLQRLLKVRLDDDTRAIHAEGLAQLTLGIERNGNKGFEGLAYDSRGQRLFVAKERDPVRIYEVAGFPRLDPAAPLTVHVLDDPRRDAGLFVRDLSSLAYDAATGHLLALSDESRLALELDVDGQPISSLSLLRGRHGLRRSIPQAEGIASDDDGNIYVVSEPNLFYRFERQR